MIKRGFLDIQHAVVLNGRKWKGAHEIHINSSKDNSNHHNGNDWTVLVRNQLLFRR